MKNWKTCPICGCRRDFSAAPLGPSTSGMNVDCPRCGRYSIDDDALAKLPSDPKLKESLCAWIRQSHEAERTHPTLTKRSLQTVLDSLPHGHRVADKQGILLQAIARRANTPAETIRLVPQNDYPLAYAANEQELLYLLEALESRELLSSDQHLDLDIDCQITPEGWNFVDERKADLNPSVQAFVAMSFDESMDRAWSEGIKPALDSVGYRPHRVDMDPHLERIDAKIQADIKDSRFLVADVTGQRQGVYFEAGYAMGLGLPVIWTVHCDEIEKVHFDTRQYRHILWQDPADLKDQLADTVAAVIGKRAGPATIT